VIDVPVRAEIGDYTLGYCGFGALEIVTVMIDHKTASRPWDKKIVMLCYGYGAGIFGSRRFEHRVKARGAQKYTQ